MQRRPCRLDLTRVEIAELARRGYALAEDPNGEAEPPFEWLESFRGMRAALARQIADVGLLNKFAEIADGPDDEDADILVETTLAQARGDKRFLGRAQRRAISRMVGALDFIVNGSCTFAPNPPPDATLPAFVRVAPQFAGAEWTRHACAMVDLGLAQTVYGGYMHVPNAGACEYWVEMNDPKKEKPTNVHYGDKYEVGNAAAVGPGASAPGAVVQDNRHGGSGSIEVSNADLTAFCTQLVTAVNERADAPDGALDAAVEAKALARAGKPEGALGVLRKGGGWLMGVMKEVATKVGQEVVLHQLGLK
jgi:hypothetical protein